MFSPETTSVLAKRPDVIEWRVDYFEGIADTSSVLEVARAIRDAAGDTPIILTRRVDPGGRRGQSRSTTRASSRLYDAVCAGPTPSISSTSR